MLGEGSSKNCQLSFVLYHQLCVGCLFAIVMASCYMLPISNASECDSRCSSQQPSRPFMVIWHQWSRTIEMIHLSPLTYSAIWQKPEKPIMPTMHHCFPLSVSFTHIWVCGFFLLCHFTFPLCLIVIAFFCPCHCFYFLDVLHFLPCPSSISLLLVHVCILYSMWQKAVLSSLCNLRYPTCSFYPLITHSFPLALVVHPSINSHKHPSPLLNL